MALISIRWHPTPKDLRIFAVLQVLFFAVVALSLHRRLAADGWAMAIMVGSVTMAGLGLVRPQAIHWFYVGWMVAVYPVGWLISHTVLAIAYFGVITPIGGLLRLSGYDPLRRRFDPNAETYWITRPEPPEKSRYFRQF